jgi:hypothetical protein
MTDENTSLSAKIHCDCTSVWSRERKLSCSSITALSNYFALSIMASYTVLQPYEHNSVDCAYRILHTVASA